ncbi:MAG: Na+/H+ antiporter NhaC family protein, partial [Aeoliella sp.]
MPRCYLPLLALLLGVGGANIVHAAEANAQVHPYGIWSLAPPLVAVVLAIATRRIVLSLLAGILAGALVTTGGDVVRAVIDLAEVHLWSTLVLPDKLRLFTFTLSIGALVGVIYANGGMRGLVDLMEPLARSRRSGQITAWLAGMVVFFDDYANTLLLGNTFRATFDRLKISREKLAYVVDSTSAPVAGLALVSTWIAVEIDYLNQGIEQLDAAIATDYRALDLFVACLPYRFYVIQALLFVPLLAILGREFGPMLTAERKRIAMGDTMIDDAADLTDVDLDIRPRSHWANAVVPIFATLTVVIGLMMQTGHAELDGKNLVPESTWRWLREVFGEANSALALQYGGLIGLAVALLMSRGGSLLTGEQCLRAAGRGAKMMLPALVILWLASGLSRMTTNKSYE